VNKKLIPVVVGALCAVAALYYRDEIMTATVSALALWKPPAKYAQAIAAAEARHGIPADMLARLLYQESRYREDIITGKTRSSVGAIGIAQFMPATAAEMGIDPLDPFQSIDGAGRYLRRLYTSLGSWTRALAAYNWGIGNVQRKGLAVAPTETVNYYSQILGDVNSYHGTAYA
jgi:soluble lytic murein transglycosylase-like protein